MNKHNTLLLLMGFLFCAKLFSQTANDFIKPYNEPFRPGTNLGYFPGLNNENLADLAAGNAENAVQGIGAKTIRTGIFNEFVEVWGYDFLEDTYDYFEARGLKENTVIVGFPAAWQRDQTFYCEDKQSTMFANLYEPIFDDGENGTPVNDDNYLALYLYKLVTRYKDHVRFWEIWNEPGSDLPTGFQVGWRQPGFPGNWWDNNPDPCDNILHAPIYHYVRTLRISYEVIKSIDPDAYVSVAGFGYPAFLDAVLRNTDNPVDGSPTEEYPLGGGAYFDVFGNHSYPHFDGSTTNFDEGRFERHSDRAADGIVTRRKEFEDVLAKYGYDGNTYPEKPSIITEINIPRKQFGNYIGGIDVQTNFILKAFIKAKTNNVFTIHPYNLIEQDEYETAGSEFGVMGMYEKFDTPGKQVPTGEAIAYKTSSDLLFNTTYDLDQTAKMNVPTGVRGHAFLDSEGQYIYTLWAETHTDFSEDVSAIYSFPNSLNLDSLELIEWDYSQTKAIDKIAAQNINLDARPIFLRAKQDTSPPSNKPNLSLSISTSDATPGIYNSTTITLHLSNSGPVSANNIIIDLPLPSELAFTGQTVDFGNYYNWNGQWIIPYLGAVNSAKLTINVFTLSDLPIELFAQIIQQDEEDENSIPNNGTCCTDLEDDETFLKLNDTQTCNCTTEYNPVCDTAGNTYTNACEALCANVTDYVSGACTTGDIDLNLNVSSSSTNFNIYETVTFSFTLENEGNSTAHDIEVSLKGQKDQLAYAGHSSTHDFGEWSGTWKIDALAPNEVATLNLQLFTLQDSEVHTIFAQVVKAPQNDIDSSPNNNEGFLPAEDDEAAVTITPFNALNGNAATFRSIEKHTKTMAIQQIMPNPVNDALNVRIFSQKEGKINIDILSPQGKLLYSQKESVKQGINIARLDLQDLYAGFYFVQLRGLKGYQKPLKFVKQGL